MERVQRTKVVYTSYVADSLIEKGEAFLHIRPDLKNPNVNIFIFKNSETFESNIKSAIQEQLVAQGKEVY